eukprot:tig00000254_g22460.t1
MWERLLARASGGASQLVAHAATLLTVKQPDRRDVDVFAQRWEEIRSFYSSVEVSSPTEDPLANPALLEASGIERSLSEMHELLRREDAGRMSDTGPCVEYLLSQKILDQLAALAIVNRPPGMQAVVIRFMTVLLKKIKQPLLPMLAVHVPVCELVRKYYLQGKGEAHMEMIELLCVLCGKMQQNPFLLNFFLVEDGVKGGDPQYLTFAALLRYMRMTDAYGEKCRAGLISLLHIDEPLLARFVVRGTHFCSDIISWVAEAHETLPRSAEAPTPLDEQSFRVFTDRLRFCNNVGRAAPPEVVHQLCEKLKEGFLTKDVQPALLQTSEAAAVAATDYARALLSALSCPPLQACLVSFLLDEAGPVFPALVSRVDSVSEELSVATLKLFDALLALHSQAVLEPLLLRHLRTHRAPLLASLPPPPPEAEAHAEAPSTPAPSSGPVPPSPGPVLPLSATPATPGLAGPPQDDIPAWLRARVSAFLAQFEGGITASGDLEEGYRSYMVDAHRAAAIALQSFAHWRDEPEEPSGAAEEAAAEESLPPLSPGPLVSALLSRLERALDNSLPVNLLLTSALARLSACPHPLAQAFLFAPLGHSFPGGEARTLARVLAQVCEEGRSRGNKIADFDRFVRAARRLLNVDEHEPADARAAAAATRRGPSGRASPVSAAVEELSAPGADDARRRVVEGVVVCEEFAKELAATLACKESLHERPFLSLGDDDAEEALGTPARNSGVPPRDFSPALALADFDFDPALLFQ